MYVYIENLKLTENYSEIDSYNITGRLNGKLQNRAIVRSTTDTYYLGRPNILLNLGYCKDATATIDVVFSNIGNYTYDSIKVFAVSMEDYEKTVSKLKENELKNLEYSNNYIKGNVDLQKDSVLQISTSYTSGWKAYINGKEVKTINVNTAFIGVPVKAGQHEIELKYTPPFFGMGIACSIIGVLVLVVAFIYEKRQ